MSNTPPNMLIIMADQLAPQYTGTYGHPAVQTPHMDELANRGSRFDNAYCNSPLCAPSRASFMSGLLPSKTGVYDNAAEFAASIPTFAHYLRAMGYRTALSGRMHFVGPDQLHGFEERLTTDVYPADFAWTPDWDNHSKRMDSWYHNMDSVTDAGVAVSTFQHDYDDEVLFCARRKLVDYARSQAHSDHPQPFCLVASFMHPHDPFVARPEWWDLYDPVAIDMPKAMIPQAEQDPLSQRLMDGIEASRVNPSAEEIRDARRGYYANTSYFDGMVGELVNVLNQVQLLEKSIVIVTSDHGEMLGERGLWYKMNFFEPSARVPLIMAGPSIATGTIPNACSLVDLLPTLVDIAAMDGAEKPTFGQLIDGRSLLPLAQGKRDNRDEAIGEYCAEMTANPVYMIRRDRYKYIHCDADPSLLYDLENDPDELINLATHPDFADIAQQFANEVQQRWDSSQLRADVIESQRKRRVVHSAMEVGTRTSWDHTPQRNASQEYVRNHIDWTEAAAKTRFPPLS